MRLNRLLAVCWCSMAMTVYADDVDKSRDLWRGVERSLQQREAEVLAPDAVAAETDALAGQGADDAHTLALTIMTAINQGDHAALACVLTIYETMPQRDEKLLRFARASLERLQGDFVTAEQSYRALLADNPNFVRARLDLAKLLFEDWQNNDARELFLEADTAHLPEAVRQNIAAYVQAVQMRGVGHGSFAVGVVHADNLNQSSRRSDCLHYNDDGSCFYRRDAPRAVRTQGLSYEAAFGKRFEVSGHHGIVLRPAIYGNFYQHFPDYNESTVSLAAGYSFRNARNDFSLTPLYEYKSYANHTLYRAPGVRFQWNRTFSEQFSGNLQIDYKHLRYAPTDYRQNTGGQTALYGTLTYAPNAHMVYYGGIDGLRQQAREATNAYYQAGVRVGMYRQFAAGFTVNTSFGLRHRRYDVYDTTLSTRRQETEQIYSLSVGAPRLSLGGLVPQLTLRHNRVKSNADWVYSHHRNEIGLKLEKYF